MIQNNLAGIYSHVMKAYKILLSNLVTVELAQRYISKLKIIKKLFTIFYVPKIYVNTDYNFK